MHPAWSTSRSASSPRSQSETDERARAEGARAESRDPRTSASARAEAPVREGVRARRAWRAARVRAHLLHHHETGLWHGRPEGRFVAIEEPETLIPVEARAEMIRRYLAAFGPSSLRDIVQWSMMHVPELKA